MAVSMLAWPVMTMASVSGDDLLEVLQHLDAGHAGHAQVEDGGVEGALFQGLDGGPAVGADGDLVAQARQLGAHELLQRLLVVDEQDAQAPVRSSRGRSEDCSVLP